MSRTRPGGRLAPLRDPAWRTATGTAIFSLLIVWLALVVFMAARHEFWRDEVRAWSLARAADSPLDLYSLIKYDGHPALWYLLLHAGSSIADSPLVLPVLSIAVAFAAVVLFVLAAPLPLWMRCLFIFSALPLYEYSVMARNYGISMLLLFVAAVLYRKRTSHPLRLACALALLANTNVHSAILACLIAAVWAWDEIEDRAYGSKRDRASSLALAFGIVCAGVVLCAVFAMPRETTILTPVRHSLDLREVGAALVTAGTRPHFTFWDLLPETFPPAPAAIVIGLSLLGLAGRPNLLLAAAGAQVGLGVLFLMVYPGWYRHQGLFLVFLVFLYWLRAESPTGRPWNIPLGKELFKTGLYGGLLVLLVANVVKLRHTAWPDIHAEKSASRRLGEFLRASDRYRDAILVPEPDFTMESLPYYAPNRIYLPRERRFGRTVSWTTESEPHLTLGALLSKARRLKMEFDVPVLLVLGNWNFEEDGCEKRFMYGKVFAWDSAELARFRESTELIAAFDVPRGDEAYAIYAVK